MSSAAAHGHDEPHVTSLQVYLGIFGALLVLTVLTVYVSAAELFHGWTSIGVAMGIAIVKASLVATIFMHMKWDRKFNVIVFLSSLWFAGLFFTFTWFDLSNRTRVHDIQQHNLPTLEKKAEAAEKEAAATPAAAEPAKEEAKAPAKAKAAGEGKAGKGKAGKH